jgi:hypothetical protein
MSHLLKFLSLLMCLLVLATAMDPCEHHGEMRRQHNCVAVRHTKADVCCWLKQDGSHGSLPYNCCGTGWKSHSCEKIIDEICETHPDDMPHHLMHF